MASADTGSTSTGSNTPQLTASQKLEKQKKDALDALEKAYA